MRHYLERRSRARRELALRPLDVVEPPKPRAPASPSLRAAAAACLTRALFELNEDVPSAPTPREDPRVTAARRTVAAAKAVFDQDMPRPKQDPLDNSVTKNLRAAALERPLLDIPGEVAAAAEAAYNQAKYEPQEPDSARADVLASALFDLAAFDVPTGEGPVPARAREAVEAAKAVFMDGSVTDSLRAAARARPLPRSPGQPIGPDSPPARGRPSPIQVQPAARAPGDEPASAKEPESARGAVLASALFELAEFDIPGGEGSLPASARKAVAAARAVFELDDEESNQDPLEDSGTAGLRAETRARPLLRSPSKPIGPPDRVEAASPATPPRARGGSNPLHVSPAERRRRALDTLESVAAGVNPTTKLAAAASRLRVSTTEEPSPRGRAPRPSPSPSPQRSPGPRLGSTSPIRSASKKRSMYTSPPSARAEQRTPPTVTRTVEV